MKRKTTGRKLFYGSVGSTKRSRKNKADSEKLSISAQILRSVDFAKSKKVQESNLPFFGTPVSA